MGPGSKQSQISFKFLPVEVGANPNQLMFAVPFEITVPGQGCAGSPSTARQTPLPPAAGAGGKVSPKPGQPGHQAPGIHSSRGREGP